jgi:pimeloyl-ACP methyl ester carboxylesterase
MRVAILLSLSLLLSGLLSAAEPLPPIPPIPRLLPPQGVSLPEIEAKQLRSQLEKLESDLQKLRRQNEQAEVFPDELYPDIEIFTKAVRYALELHEFYDLKKDLPKAYKLLDEARRRLTELQANKPRWTETFSGLTVRGYRSRIDGSVQPYGIVWPENCNTSNLNRWPVYVWLHGRGDKATDMHFIHERMHQLGQLGPMNAIVLHPFGRQCVGFKSAGERDVLDVLEAFNHAYSEDGLEILPARTVLIGFSMGGAGAWHIGAHYPHLFAAVAPGAGFAETALYTKTDPATVPWYERRLWGVYDVPRYTRNLFNTEVIAYSGENDKQIQAARVMEAAFQAEGRTLTHLIGPGVAHAYEPKTLEELKFRLESVLQSQNLSKTAYFMQSSAPQYSRVVMGPRQPDGTFTTLSVTGLANGYRDTRCEIDVTSLSTGIDSVALRTKNVSGFSLSGRLPTLQKLDQQEWGLVPVVSNFQSGKSSFWKREQDRWLSYKPNPGRLKHPILCGPIDHAFMSPFVVVRPTGKSKHPLVQRWVEFELQHFIDRWRALMRGDVRVMNDTEVLANEANLGKFYNFICFGDPDSNAVIRQHAKRLPVTWADDRVVAGKESWSAASHVPVAIYPLSDDVTVGTRYLVINSGLTFREAHDKTNAQQNPKLPDWAVVDLAQLPDATSPGRVVTAGFFGGTWEYIDPALQQAEQAP